jgi:hypothetical protein
MSNNTLQIELKQIDQEMTLFAVTWTTDVNELKRNYGNDLLNQSTEHFSAIIAYLLTVRVTTFHNPTPHFLSPAAAAIHEITPTNEISSKPLFLVPIQDPH